MKKFVLLFIFLSLFCFLWSNNLVLAQDEVTVTYSQGGGENQGVMPLNVIKWNIRGVFAGQYQLVYERVLNEQMSVQLSAGYIIRPSSQSIESGSTKRSYKAKTTGFIIIPEFRYYIISKYPVPKGFYIAPFARIRAVTQVLNDINVDPCS